MISSRMLAATTLFGALLLFSGCGGPYSSPEAASKTFMEAVKTQDKAKQKEAMLKSDAAELSKPGGDAISMNGDGSMVSYEIGAAKVSGDTATVAVTYVEKKDGKEETDTMELHLKTEDGLWKVNFSETVKALFAAAIKK